MRANPLDSRREPRMGRMALVPIAAAALFALAGFLSQKVTEAQRVAAVEAAVRASGRVDPVHVRPMAGGECWRAREGFRWRAGAEEGWACAGPGDEVTLIEVVPRRPSEP